MTGGLDDILASLEEALDRRTHRKLDFFEPYPKQAAFFALGATKRERLLIAGNQLGKSEAGAAEFSYHLTGRYPFYWTGRRYPKPIRAWAAGESSLVVRDVQQKKLCGQAGVTEAYGTGYIPKDDFADKPSMARGVTDAYDTIQVNHHRWDEATKLYVKDGVSTASFKSYEQGRTKFQGEPVDLIWCDEEPPMDVYSECLTRITATRGMIFVTFTPLKGMSDVVRRYLSEKSDDRDVVTMTIYDAKHIAPEDRDAIIAGYPAHERDARAMGVPILGSGRIFPIEDSLITENPLDYIPLEWTKLWSIDFGIAHPFAAVLSLWDRDTDIFHIHHAFKIPNALPLQHAAAMKPIGAAVPVAWPHDGGNREKSSGDELIDSYRKQELICLPGPAQFETGGNSVEAGLLEMNQRMTTGRFKVSRVLMQGDWGDEFRFYHRKDGLIVKDRDDLMDATRIGVMARRHGRAVILGGKRAKNRQVVADDVDFDLFG